MQAFKNCNWPETLDGSRTYDTPENRVFLPLLILKYFVLEKNIFLLDMM